ncbi:SMT3/SUMO-activating complex, catalytic component UBA2 [Trachipleistophora hominis]|uniref:SMT3/SUMO-activating complex, catalytic component UBA2 n=1 Tax=Trachipleistophora hominis TaxID=72359 RepID=L7JWB7_TRAHO|nr:SMT3/SUMO-activating complex, catalytic component UBA2 [Trachipleistophora hominis]
MEGNVLVVGCGGIGCELLKLLILKGVKRVTVVDNDTIEITNLNRQFFFTKTDVGKFKADVTKSYYEKMVSDATITSYTENVINTKFDLEFFKNFEIVYNCLDNIEARSYVNLRCRLACIPLVDGGSAGYLGQSMVFFKNECYDCTPKAQDQSFPICTIRGKPDNFTHCIAYAKEYAYTSIRETLSKYRKFQNVYKFLFPGNECGREAPKIVKKLMKYHAKLKKKNFPIFNKDNKTVVKFIYYMALVRAHNYNIAPENFFEAERIIKNIIPSVCTTNAAVASLMLISARKLLHSYFLTKNKKLIIKNSPSLGSNTCGICGTKWFVLYLNSNILMISDLLENLGLENAILAVDNRFYDAQKDVGELNVSHNSIMIVKSGLESFKFYIDVNSRCMLSIEECTFGV